MLSGLLLFALDNQGTDGPERDRPNEAISVVIIWVRMADDVATPETGGSEKKRLEATSASSFSRRGKKDDMMMASYALLTKCVVVPNDTVNRLPLSASSAFRKVQKVRSSVRSMGSSASSSQRPDSAKETSPPAASLSDDELKKRLTHEQYYVTRQKGTERAFTGEYWKTKTPGTYHCVCCESPLFESSTKYDSGTGWPSYYQPIGNNVKSKLDLSIIFMPREEVLCSSCDAHLGHVFDDGPPPTGKRYCINSASLKLKPK